VKRVLCIVVASAALCSPAVARAQDETLDAAAETRFKEGLAQAKAGNYDLARASFLQTLALSPGSPKVLLNLAISEYGAGRFADALGHLKAHLASPKVDPRKAQELRATMYDELWKKTGHLRIQADRGEAIALGDGSKLGNAPLADVVDVTPGRYRVIAGAKSLEVTVGAGETKDVALATAATTAAPPLPFHDVVPPAEGPKGTIWKPMTFVLGGATLVTAGLALYFNGKSNSAFDRADAIRTQNAGADCTAPGAPSFCGDLKTANDDQDSAASASRIFWIGSGVLLAGSIVSGVLWATAGSTKTSGLLLPSLGPTGAGATYRFAF